MVTVILPVNLIRNVSAEQTGSSPESGSNSRIKDTYDSLVYYGYGSETAGSWGDWGSFWNRVRSAAEWTPGGDALPEDVATGKTFFSDSRGIQNGTGPLPIDYSLQRLDEYDDSEDGEYMGEESTWTQTNISPEVWKDDRTGLYWSSVQGTNYTNIFPDSDHSTCNFFNSTNRGGYDGSDNDCGQAINQCASLILARNGGEAFDLDWYLPSHKELLQAYIDGMYNKAGASFTSPEDNYYWSSTEVAYLSYRAFAVGLNMGYADGNSKNWTNSVRCVSREDPGQ